MCHVLCVRACQPSTCVRAWAHIYAHHAVAFPVVVAVSLSLSLSLSQSLMSIALLQALFHPAWL